MITTKKGDNGYTDSSKGRVRKSSAIIEFYGALDEAIAFAGITFLITKENIIDEVQNDLQHLFIGPCDVKKYEALINKLEKGIALDSFVKPKGKSSYIHYLRTLVRRCERKAVKANVKYAVPCLNRMSDLLFLVALKQAKKDKTLIFFNKK